MLVVMVSEVQVWHTQHKSVLLTKEVYTIITCIYMTSKGPPYIAQACSSRLAKNRSDGVISLLNFISQKSDQHVSFLYGIIVHI